MIPYMDILPKLIITPGYVKTGMVLKNGHRYLFEARGIITIVEASQSDSAPGGWHTVKVIKVILNPTTEVWDEGRFYNVNPGYCSPIHDPNDLIKDIL